MATTDPAALGRYSLTQTPAMRTLLQQASGLADTQETQLLLEQYSDKDTVPWRLVQLACSTLRQQQATPSSTHSSPAQQPQQEACAATTAAAICAGSALILPSPPARQRSEALQQRLAQLQHNLDAQRYSAMVADVSPAEQAAAQDDPFFPSTRLQLSFGLHVIVTMGPFCALGWYGGSVLLHSQAWAAICCCIGMVCGLLLETSLLIVRMNMPAPLDKKYGHLLNKDWDKKQLQEQQPPRQQQQQQGMKAGMAAKTAARGAQAQQRGAAVSRQRAA